MIWGGKRRNSRGDGHADLVSKDGLNATYLRDTSGKVVTDERREWAKALAREAGEAANSREPTHSPARLRSDWQEHVESGGAPGKQLAKELSKLRSQFERDVGRIDAPPRDERLRGKER